MNDVHVVVGATGATGTSLVHELLRRGHRVRAVHRSGDGRFPAGVEVAAGDAADAARMRELCADAVVVHNCINPPLDRWRTTFPDAVRATIAAAGAAGARLVFADDTWMYGRVDAPMTESTAVRPSSDLGTLRAWLAEMVLAAHARGDCRTVIGRAGELYGPRVESLIGGALFGAAVAGRPVRWIGGLDQPITPTYIDDFATVLATLGDADEADLGRVWHVPHPGATTGRAFVREVLTRAGTSPPSYRLGSRVVRALGMVWPLARLGGELAYQFEMPFVVDGSAAAEHFDLRPTPYEDGITRTVAWYRRSRPQ